MKLTFETAALADVISRAARVAPTKGAAFDKAAGVVMEYDPDATEQVTVKATDLEVTFLERMTVVAGPPSDTFTWRIPSALFAGILSNLPIGTTTSLEEKDGTLHIVCGKAKAKIVMYPDVIIKFAPFDPSELTEVPGFAARVAQVSWACDRNAVPFTGVHINGTMLIGTDRYRLATVPLEVPVAEPLTVPLDVLTFVSKGAVDASLAAVHKRLHLLLSGQTQITSVIYDAKYPDVKRAMYDDYPDEATCQIDKEAVRSAINRMLVLVKGERYPLMRLTVGQERIHILLDVPEVGVMEDEIPVIGADHEDCELMFTPVNFVDGISHAAKPEIQFSYDPRTPHKNILFDDGDGYRCWVVPRRPTTGSVV